MESKVFICIKSMLILFYRVYSIENHAKKFIAIVLDNYFRVFCLILFILNIVSLFIDN